MREAATVGIKAAFEGVDMPGVQKYKNSIVSRMHKGLEGLVSSRGIDLSQGWDAWLLPTPSTLTVAASPAAT